MAAFLPWVFYASKCYLEKGAAYLWHDQTKRRIVGCGLPYSYESHRTLWPAIPVSAKYYDLM
jgi:hypothetical protein